jgi:uncharacterized protein (TIGR02145 family)
MILIRFFRLTGLKLKKMKAKVFILLAAISFSTFAQDAKIVDEGVIINGVKWATRNVAAPGTFADKPEDPGMLYQWNRKKAWSATGDVAGWDTTVPEGDTWEKSNDPSPAGWRVPTFEEIKTLFDTDKVSNERTTRNGVNGRKFTDKVTGNFIFLPAVGIRDYSDGTLYYAGSGGYYWSSTADEFYETGAYNLGFGSGGAGWKSYDRHLGLSVRAVAELDSTILK